MKNFLPSYLGWGLGAAAPWYFPLLTCKLDKMMVDREAASES
jgi:hypothetical protein